MALEGNLTAFGLSEILQLIAVQQKTGMLTITNLDNTTVMFFRNGEVVSTRDRRRKARDAFKDYLTRYGVLEHDALVRVAQLSSQSKLDFLDVVKSEGLIEPEELKKHWRAQIQETMHDVLTWEEGSYKFVTSNDLVDGIKTLETFNVEGMLMESMRRIDEFPQMLEMFPSEKLIFSRRGEPGGAGPDQEMTRNETFVLSLLDAPATLGDLIGRGRMPVFEVYEALKNLRDKDLLDVEEPQAADDEPAGKKKRTASKRQFKNVAPVIISFVLFGAAMYVGFGDSVEKALAVATMDISTAQVMNADIDPAEFIAGDDAVRRRIEFRLRHLIEAYRAEYGRYPATLGQLADAQLAPDGFMQKARTHEFRYRLTAGGAAYTLL
jgi:hypothetical protein